MGSRLLKAGLVVTMFFDWTGARDLAGITFVVACVPGLLIWIFSTLFGPKRGPSKETRENKILNILFCICVFFMTFKVCVVSLAAVDVIYAERQKAGVAAPAARDRPPGPAEPDKISRDESAVARLKAVREPRQTQAAVERQLPVIAGVVGRKKAAVLSTLIGDLNAQYHRMTGDRTPIPPDELFTTDGSLGRITPGDYLVLLGAAVKVHRSEPLSDVEIEIVADILARMADGR